MAELFLRGSTVPCSFRIGTESLGLFSVTFSHSRRLCGNPSVWTHHPRTRICDRSLANADCTPRRPSVQVCASPSSALAQTPRPPPKVSPPAHPTYDLLSVIRLALSEDAGDGGDVTCLATIPASTQAEAKFLAKADGILAGTAVTEMVCQEVDPDLEVVWTVEDGEEVRRGMEFGTLRGSARSILIAERVALNFMQRMSGIATATHVRPGHDRWQVSVQAMAEAARPARILETRKTAPGLRLVDKWAVLIGGGENHRMGLYDMVLIKDNHIAAAGGIPQAVEAAKAYLQQNGMDIGVEVETRTLDEVREVMTCRGSGVGRVTRVMLDNMVTKLPGGGLDTSMLEEAVNIIGGQLETEASGNVTIDTVHQIGATGVTYISSGALTHSVTALDISLNINTELALEVGKRTNTV